MVLLATERQQDHRVTAAHPGQFRRRDIAEAGILMRHAPWPPVAAPPGQAQSPASNPQPDTQNGWFMSALPHDQKIVPVILSGGSGTRLWPVSRKSFPKQFWPLTAARSMLVETALRAAGEDFTPPIVVTNQDHRFVVAEQLREAGIGQARILLEPAGRNSAPAIAAAALLAAETHPDGILWIMAADASIGDLPALGRAIRAAATAAAQGYFVTFGMQPTSAETGYGYIAQGAAIPNLPGVFKLDRFIEKPTASRAAELIANGGNLWNSGMFMFTPALLLAEMERHAPAVLHAVQTAMQTKSSDLDFTRLGSPAFESAPDISIDYAIAEKTDKAVVVPAAIGWSDVGSWSALADIAPKDAAGNVALGDVVIEDSRNSYARSDGTITALLGVDDLVVVTTQDAVLVAHKNHTQNVKKNRRPPKSRTTRPGRLPQPHLPPLGLLREPDPGRPLPGQTHLRPARPQTVAAKTLPPCRTLGRRRRLRRRHLRRRSQTGAENESIYLPLGCIHRLENPAKSPSR